MSKIKIGVIGAGDHHDALVGRIVALGLDYKIEVVIVDKEMAFDHGIITDQAIIDDIIKRIPEEIHTLTMIERYEDPIIYPKARKKQKKQYKKSSKYH